MSPGVLGFESAQFSAHPGIFNGKSDDKKKVRVFERFCQIVVGTQLPGLYCIVKTSMGGKHDGNNPGLDLLQAADHLQAVHPGHLFVNDGDIQRLGRSEMKRLNPLFCREDFVPFSGED
jgi:hypothetical protein